MLRLENPFFTFVPRLLHFHRFHNLDFDNLNISNKNQTKMVRILKAAWCPFMSTRMFCCTSNAFSTISKSGFQKCSKTNWKMIRLENSIFTFVPRLMHFHRFHNLDFDNLNISNKNKAKMVRTWCAHDVQRSVCSTSNAFSTVSISTLQKCSKTIRKWYVCGFWNQLGARWCPLAAFVLRLPLFQHFRDLAFKSVPKPLESDTFGEPDFWNMLFIENALDQCKK